MCRKNVIVSFLDGDCTCSFENDIKQAVDACILLWSKDRTNFVKDRLLLYAITMQKSNFEEAFDSDQPHVPRMLASANLRFEFARVLTTNYY